MKIIIAGCGKIGSTILSSLVSEEHDVIALDNDAAVISEITNMYDVMGVCGNAADCETLEEADVQGAELFVASTNSDELNMLSCFLARKMGAKHTVARIRNPEYNDGSLTFMRQHLNLSFSINPEFVAARELYNILKLPSAAKIETFSRRNFEMIELRLKPNSVLDGIKIMDLRTQYKEKFLVCAVQRGEEVYIPDGNFELKSGDKIGITATPASIHKLLRSMGILQKQARSVMILGGGRVSYYIAKMLLNIGTSVKIIEKDYERCQTLCELLPKAEIVHGDGAKQEVLIEEGLPSMDAFLALTGIDEQNVLISIFASSQNVPKVITKVNREELASMAEKLGLDCIVSPKKTISDVITTYARALQNSLGSNVETLYHIMDDKAEVLEFNVKEGLSFLGVPLKDVSMKQNTLIAGIFRDRKIIVPTGDDQILAGDKVVVLTANHRLQDLSDIVIK